MVFIKKYLVIYLLFLSFSSKFLGQKLPNFSTSLQQKFQSFEPIDITIPQANKTEIIYLKDNKTQIYEFSNGQIYIKHIDPESNKEYMINLDNIQSDYKFTKNEDNKTTEDTSTVAKTFPVFEWTPLIGKNSYPHKRRGHSSIVLDNYIVFFGGCHLDLECYNDVYFFDMETFEWTTPKIQGSAPCEREGHTAVLYGSKMYVFGGSSTSGFLSDLFELDLLNMVWTQLNFVGTSPKGISNHKGVADNNGRIVVFGGYNDEGYSNDIYFIDLVNKRWIKPMINGRSPRPKEHFSMTYIRGKIWIFGGYTTGGVLNDLNVLDLDTLAWVKADTTGNKPNPRQGHVAVKQGKELFIIGGCNYKMNVCYKETYLLNTESLFWTKISDESQTVFTERNGHTANSIGELIVLFGGCKLMDSCSNDIMVLNTNLYCPLNCSNSGVCRNKRCLCFKGFQENDCSIELKCHLDCSNRGKCQSDGKCGCYPGYTGQDCELYIPCPSNCTSESNGICKSDSTCKCYLGFQGEACEIAGENQTTANLTQVMVGCKNNCTDRGICNTILGVCICEFGFFGNDCEQKSSEFVNDTSIANTTNNLTKVDDKNQTNNSQNTNDQNEINNKNVVNETEAKTDDNNSNSSNSVAKNLAQKDSKYNIAMIKQNVSNTTTNKTENDSTNNETTNNIQNNSSNSSIALNDTDNTVKNNNTASNLTINQSKNATTYNASNISIETAGNISSNISNKTISSLRIKKEGNRSLTAQMFGLADDELASQKSDKNKSLEDTYNVQNCDNACNYNGLCSNNVCYCRQGFTGADCSFSKIVDLQKGEKVGNLLILVGSSLLFGLIVGSLLLWYLGRQTQKEELRGIKQEEEQQQNGDLNDSENN